MKRHALIYGLLGGVLITLLQWTEYRFLIVEHSWEIYGGLTAITFAALGVWLGQRLVAPARPVAPRDAPEAKNAASVEPAREAAGMTRRELEILSLIAEGLSNKEIAGKLFVSENTVKTHASRVFDKLGARRRTQAVQMGKELGLLP